MELAELQRFSKILRVDGSQPKQDCNADDVRTGKKNGLARDRIWIPIPDSDVLRVVSDTVLVPIS